MARVTFLLTNFSLGCITLKFKENLKHFLLRRRNSGIQNHCTSFSKTGACVCDSSGSAFTGPASYLSGRLKPREKTLRPRHWSFVSYEKTQVSFFQEGWRPLSVARVMDAYAQLKKKEKDQLKVK